MRLSPDEITAIKTAARDVFGVQAQVRVFGSRVHDHLRGGDIDLHVEVGDGQGSLDQKINFQVALWQALGERQVDIVLHEKSQPYNWLDRIAIESGQRI